MDKKPIILMSILAVVLLILCSLSNVVGYQSVKSTAMNDSPLFSIRTKRSTANEDNGVITSDYLGKGLNTIQFPLRDNRTVMIQKFLGRIRTMDEDTFNNFITMIISLIQKEPKFHNVNTKELVAVFYQVKNTQNMISNKDIDFNHKADEKADTLLPLPPFWSCSLICILLQPIFWIAAFTYILFSVIITIFFRDICMSPSFTPTCLLISK